MRYVFCVILPPLAVLSTGRFLSFLFNLVLTLFFWIPGMIHAFFIVNDYKNDQRFKRLEKRTRARA